MNKIYLKGANNARDFGGIRNVEGKIIKENLFLRSNALDKLTKKDVEVLKAKNIRTIIDLRTYVEKTNKPNVKIDGVEYIHIPVFAEEVMGITHENNKDPRKMLDCLPDMTELFRVMVSKEECISQFKKVFEVITDESREGAILWHCTEGKDRCGLTSAFFLFLLGVSREEVWKDFDNTNIASVKKARKLGGLTYLVRRDKALAKQVYDIFLAKEEYFTAAIETIDEKWGGIDAFLTNQLGITDEVRERMKRKAFGE